MSFLQYVLASLLATSVTAWENPTAAPAAMAFDPVKDVLIFGGGAAGAYAAVQLHDLGRSVVVIEPTARLGGNAETYHDGKGGVFNAGVRVLRDIPVVSDFFSRLGVPLDKERDENGTVKTVYADFSQGQGVPEERVQAKSNATTIRLALERYAKYLEANFSTVGYCLNDPVEEDFVMPWGQFVTKYGLEPMANLVNTFIQPAEATLEPAIYPLKFFSLDVLSSLKDGFRSTRDMQDLYNAADKVLNGSVLYNATAVSVKRYNDGSAAEVKVQLPQGKTKVVRARQLLFTAPPTLQNLKGWDLTAEEKQIFEKFKSQQYYAGIIRHKGLNESTELQNIDFSSKFNIPKLPALYNVVPTGLGDHQFAVYYSARTRVEPDAAKYDIIAALDRLAANGVIPQDHAEFLAWYDHPNVRMYVEVEDIRKGFYDKLYGLQGKTNTYWSGAAWVSQASSPIWDYTKSIVEQMLRQEDPKQSGVSVPKNVTKST